VSLRRLLWAAKWTVKAITPPILVLALKWLLIGLRLRRRDTAAAAAPAPSERPAAEPAEWEYIPEGWEHPETGWDVETVARAYRRKWPAYLAAIEPPRPLGVYYETAEVLEEDLGAHNMLVSFAYVLALSARRRDRLSVLDWGGGLGHYYALARSVVPDLELDYHVKETPTVCAQGRDLLPAVAFHDDDRCLERRYDLVLASSSLQYAPDWRSLVTRLADAAQHRLFLARLPLVLRAEPFVVLQRAYQHGYETEYLGWVFSRPSLLDAVRAAGLQLEREFLLGARFSAAGAPEDPVDHRSFLFTR
jgi:putative methyltransferase (TIGR04325 family)